MTRIAKTDDLPDRIRAAIDSCGAHPSRTLVLVPFAQLMKSLRATWALTGHTGFVPWIETTINAARTLAMQSAFADSIVVSPTDLTFDAARDVLIAQSLLEKAGLAKWRNALAPGLLDAAMQLAPVAASHAPGERAEWASRMQASITEQMDLGVLEAEAAVANLALIWAGMSSYETDVLFSDEAWTDIDCVVLLKGFQDDPVTDAVISRCRHVIAIELERAAPSDVELLDGVNVYQARDAEDEAELAAAVVIGHVERGLSPIALVANDRELTRRVRARLAAKNIEVDDETGWKLSTTRAAAHLMSALRALVFDASSDAVLDWIKQAPAVDANELQMLEAWLRRNGAGRWSSVNIDGERDTMAARLAKRIDVWRDAMSKSRPLLEWIDAFGDLLRETGQWSLLETDSAGEIALSALHMNGVERENIEGLVRSLGAKPQRSSLGEFTSWANGVLEAGSFRPRVSREAAVIVLPMSQLLARPFSAVVIPGCDEIRLASSPEPAGAWTAAQRELLGLPTRDKLQSQIRAAWNFSLGFARVDLLWRSSDTTGEPILASPLVQLLLLDHALPLSADPRATREVLISGTTRPSPHADTLPLKRLSASSYEDLRRCPYRFFALRNLGLQEADELDSELDKRDFGNWLHEVLNRFHLRVDAKTPSTQRASILDECARQATESMRLPEGEFLPFAATWPAVRDGYLKWLSSHESQGLAFGEAEVRLEQTLVFEGGKIALVGQLDRIDRIVGSSSETSGDVFVMDYKTEHHEVTKKRVKTPLEDTQLAFYAALVQGVDSGDSAGVLRAAYVNVGDRDGTNTVEQIEVVVARDALLAGIRVDMERISKGASLPALGEGAVCEYCAARGLCRKDFWQ